MNFLFTFRIKISHYDIMATNIQQCIENIKSISKNGGYKKRKNATRKKEKRRARKTETLKLKK